MLLCQCVCIPVFLGVQVLKRFFFFAESILQGSGTYVSLCKLSSWSPLWESLAVKLILLSHTPLSVPHLSAQPQGPSCSFSTPGFPFFFSPTSKIHWLAAPIEIELDKFKRRGRGSINGQQGDRMGKRQTQIVSGWTERMSSECRPTSLYSPCI